MPEQQLYSLIAASTARKDERRVPSVCMYMQVCAYVFFVYVCKDMFPSLRIFTQRYVRACCSLHG